MQSLDATNDQASTGSVHQHRPRKLQRPAQILHANLYPTTGHYHATMHPHHQLTSFSASERNGPRYSLVSICYCTFAHESWGCTLSAAKSYPSARPAAISPHCSTRPETSSGCPDARATVSFNSSTVAVSPAVYIAVDALSTSVG